MDTSLIGLVVAVLTLVVAFNLFLTLRMAAIVGTREYMRSPSAVPIGTILPRFTGRKLVDGRRLSADDMAGQAAVFVFLSPECSECRVRVQEIAEMYTSIRCAGIALWVVGSHSKKRLAKFLKETPLLEHVLLVSTATRRRLNPRNAAPFYLFVDHQRTVLASNFIGDDNWLSFVEQMREAELEAEMPS